MTLLQQKLSFTKFAVLFLLILSAPKLSEAKPLLLAENEVDDSYDPFSDYSEFDEASDEEADINFFRHGRFLTMGFDFGMRGFTGELNKLYSSGPTYGLFLAYFMDMRSALELGFNTGDHKFALTSPNGNLNGNVSMTFINLNYKYYFNTQNLTRGMGALNPYILGGFAQVFRTYTLEGADNFSRESTTGLNAGLGFEVPIMRKKAFIGAQAIYRYVNFRDENSTLKNPTAGIDYGVKPSGDTFDITAIVGLSF